MAALKKYCCRTIVTVVCTTARQVLHNTTSRARAGLATRLRFKHQQEKARGFGPATYRLEVVLPRNDAGLEAGHQELHVLQLYNDTGTDRDSGTRT